MYKIKDFDADGLVEISLLCEENIDKEMFTRWDLYSSEIDLGEVECEFEKKPSEEEVEQHITQLFKEYVEGVMGGYTVEQMSMNIYDENESEMNDEGLNWEDVLELRWGEITYLSININQYNVEEIKE